MRPMRKAVTAATTLVLLWLPAAALAQTTPNPTAPPPQPVGGWTIWQGIGAIVLSTFFLAGLVGAYLKFAPTFYGTDRKPEGDRRKLPPGARTAAALALQQPQALAASPQAPPAPARQASAPGPGAAAASQATATATPKPQPQQQEVAEKPAEEVKAKEEEQAAPPASGEAAEEAQAAAPSEAEAAERDEQPQVQTEKPGGEQQPDARGPENIVDTEAPADESAAKGGDASPS
ncbi:MAG: hypothetical protein LC722_02280 [Actinobacteria bacterium]|nr:hypothetical protein [Actinomycetota bacterium]